MRFLALAAIAASTLPAAANQVVLYEGKEFRGRHVTISQSTSNLAYFGFENRASSLYVMSGTWEFCTEPDFRGQCRTLSAGEYPSLGQQTNRISSARLIDDAPGSGDLGGSGQAEVTLYDRTNFGGPLRTLRAATVNFEPIGINDAAASLIVRRGTWQFCTDAGYRGECVTYGPGRYSSLPGLDDRFSSARPVSSGWGAGGGGWGGGGGPPGKVARIRLFEHADYGGRSIWLDRDASNFDPLGFNDRASSLIVEGGTWRLCSDARGQGYCRVFRPGQYPVLPPELSNRVSSAFADR